MTRLIYRLLLCLHPPSFRRRFGGEMLSIFDDAHAAEGSAPLLLDAALSLTRRWLLRTPLWLVFPALAGAGATVSSGLFVLRFRPNPAGGLARLSTESPQGFILMAGIVSVTIVALTLILCVSWFRFSRRRCA